MVDRRERDPDYRNLAEVYANALIRNMQKCQDISETYKSSLSPEVRERFESLPSDYFRHLVKRLSISKNLELDAALDIWDERAAAIFNKAIDAW